MTGFYLVSGADWRRLLSCLIGFVVARQLVTRLSRAPEADQTHHAQEVRHAP